MNNCRAPGWPPLIYDFLSPRSSRKAYIGLFHYILTPNCLGRLVCPSPTSKLQGLETGSTPRPSWLYQLNQWSSASRSRPQLCHQGANITILLLFDFWKKAKLTTDNSFKWIFLLCTRMGQPWDSWLPGLRNSCKQNTAFPAGLSGTEEHRVFHWPLSRSSWIPRWHIGGGSVRACVRAGVKAGIQVWTSWRPLHLHHTISPGDLCTVWCNG